MKVRTLIVDDEPLARESARRLLARDPEIEVVGEAGDGTEALRLVAELRPELVLLDVQMPEMSGLEVAQGLPAGAPRVVFVTAFDRYALEAFELNAVGYLLKPYTDERFSAVLSRAKHELRTRDLAEVSRQMEQVLTLLRGTAAIVPPPGAETVTFRADGELHVLRVSDVRWIGGEGDYLKVYAAGGTLFVRETIRQFLARAGRDFMRVHKSTVVNPAHISTFTHLGAGDYQLKLSDGTLLRVSRTHRDEVFARLSR